MYQNLKNKISSFIENRKTYYQQNIDDMIAAFNRERETEKEYNGRQLLELLQNADDQISNSVLIELNSNLKTLKICNSGENCVPFSFEGIKSLMISDLSPKTTKKYIGNKGLGFRSIINWSQKITINNGDIDIIFSKDIVDNIYNDLFSKE